MLDRAERVIDLYVDVLWPLIETDVRLANQQYMLGEPPPSHRRPPRLSFTLLSAGPSNFFPAFNEVGGYGAPQDNVLDGWLFLAPDTFTRALQHVTGQAPWSEVELAARPALRRIASITLARGPGVILVQPQPVVPIPVFGQDEEQGARPAFRYSYTLNDSIELYSGQQLIGTGLSHALPEFRSRPGQRIGRQVPFVERTTISVGARLSAPIIMRNCDSVVVRQVGISGNPNEPADAAIDAENASHTLIADVSISPGFRHPVRFRGRGSMNWVELADVQQDYSVQVSGDVEDTTLWYLDSTRVELGGRNCQIWYSIVEPEVGPGPGAFELALNGPANAGFACRIEGAFHAGLQAEAGPAGPQPPQPAVVRVGSRADFAHFSMSHVTQSGFPILVDRDCASTLLRQAPLRAHGADQPTLELGLTNLLADSTFERGLVGTAWRPRGLTAEIDRRVRRAYDQTLSIVPESADEATLAQSIGSNAQLGVETLADRTFAAGCWVRATAGAEVVLYLDELLEEAFGDRVARVEPSNPHPGDGRFHFLSTMLHTTLNAKAVRCRLAVRGQGLQVHVSEPILVRGAYLPPHHARPLTEASGGLAGMLSLAAPSFSMLLSSTSVGTLAIGDSWTCDAVASRLLETPARLVEVQCAVWPPYAKAWIGVQIDSGDAAPLRLSTYAAGGTPAILRPSSPVHLPRGSRCSLLATSSIGRGCAEGVAAALRLDREV